MLIEIDKGEAGIVYNCYQSKEIHGLDTNFVNVKSVFNVKKYEGEERQQPAGVSPCVDLSFGDYLYDTAKKICLKSGAAYYLKNNPKVLRIKLKLRDGQVSVGYLNYNTVTFITDHPTRLLSDSGDIIRSFSFSRRQEEAKSNDDVVAQVMKGLKCEPLSNKEIDELDKHRNAREEGGY